MKFSSNQSARIIYGFLGVFAVSAGVISTIYAHNYAVPLSNDFIFSVAVMYLGGVWLLTYAFGTSLTITEDLLRNTKGFIFSKTISISSITGLEYKIGYAGRGSIAPELWIHYTSNGANSHLMLRGIAFSYPTLKEITGEIQKMNPSVQLNSVVGTSLLSPLLWSARPMPTTLAELDAFMAPGGWWQIKS